MYTQQDLSAVGLTNESYPYQDVAAIRRSVLESKETLDRVKRRRVSLRALQEKIGRKIEQTLTAEKELDETIKRCTMALASPRILDDDILRNIFTLLVEDYGLVSFPLKKPLPPQLVLSHVCSKWRSLVLNMRGLWNSAHIESISQPRVCQLLQRWLSRALNEPVRMSMNLHGSAHSLGQQSYVSRVQKIMMPFRIRNLHLKVSSTDLSALTVMPLSILPVLEELALTLTSYKDVQTLYTLPPFIAQTRSIEFMDPACKASEFPLDPRITFPWDQMRCLDLRLKYLTLQVAAEFLRRMPNLRELLLSIQLGDGNPVEELTLPDLKELHFVLDNSTPVDGILPNFRFPSLTSMNIESSTDWTHETYGTIQRQYNLQHCEVVRIPGGCALKLSTLLKDAPVVRRLTLPADAVMDDHGLTDVASGALGRFLTSIRIENLLCDVDDILDMVEKRQKNVQNLIGRNCTWREELSLLREVDLTPLKIKKIDKERLKTLEVVGVKVLL